MLLTYIYDLINQDYYNVTRDIFSDSYPSWDPTGSKVLFVSDRANYTNQEFNGKMYNHDFSQTDIYVVDILNHKIKRLTETDHNESHPIWSKTENSIFYTSDFNGVWNLYIQDLEVESSQGKSLTNVLTGLPATNNF